MKAIISVSDDFGSVEYSVPLSDLLQPIVDKLDVLDTDETSARTFSVNVVLEGSDRFDLDVTRSNGDRHP